MSSTGSEPPKPADDGTMPSMPAPEAPLRDSRASETSAELQSTQRAAVVAGSVSPPAPSPKTGFGPAFDMRASPSRAMTARLAENWWAVGARGVAAILFGLVALLAPGPTLISLALVFAVYMLADGVLGIVAAIQKAQKHERWGLLVLEGAVDIVTGLAILVWPVLTVVVFVVMMAIWALVSGGLMFAAALKLDKDHGRTWLALGGVASILLGIMLAIAPLLGALVLAWWIGAYAIAFGGLLIALASKLKARRDANAAEPKPA